MKKSAVSFSIVLLVGILAGCASGNRWQDIRWNGDLNQIQAAELNSLEQKFCSDSVKLRKRIRATSEELINTQLNTSDTDSKKVQALQAELREYSADMIERVVNFELEARKIAPDTNYVRRAYIRNYNWICERQPWSIAWVSAQDLQ
jgi:zinc resistance-associated protein